MKNTFQIVSVDDNVNNLMLIESYCEEINLGVKSFSDLTKALMYVFGHEPDLIILDYMMPALNGIEFLQAYRASYPHVPIIMVTAAGDDDNLQLEALKAGVNDFLSKPVNRIHFQLRIQNLLKLRQAHILLSDRAKLLEYEVRVATEKIRKREFETLFILGRAAEYKDSETASHVMRVAHYSRLLAYHLGYSDEEQELLFHASSFHDIGKVGVPDSVLLKNAKLDDDELETMKKHPFIGHDILKKAESPYLKKGAIVALTHHEKYDGSGYPKGLKGEDIPIEGRIVAISDVFDALTSARPYKEAWSFEHAVMFLQDERGKHFDPTLVDIFIEQIDAVKEIYHTYEETEN